MATQRRKDNKNRVLKDGEHQRPNGTYEYKWRDKKGKRHSIYAPTLEALRDKEADLLRDILDGIKVNNDLTINDVYERWKQIKRGLRDTTFSNYRYMYDMFVAPEFGKNKISDLKKSDVRAFYNYLVDTKKLAIATVDSIHTVLHQVLDVAVEDEYIRFNPSDSALKELKRTHNVGEQKHKALTIPEMELFQSFLRDTPQFRHWYPVFTVMLWTGMRVGEVTGLNWEDIDFENNVIRLSNNLVYFADLNEATGKRESGFKVHKPKSKAGIRNIPMLPQVREALLLEKEYQDLCDIKCNANIDGFSNFIFVNRFGDVQHQGTLNKALDRIIRQCNDKQLDSGVSNPVLLPKFSNHSLRHTFITRLCEAKVGIKAIQDIVGHADPQTTLAIYAEVTESFKESEMQNFKAFYDSIKTLSK